MRTAGLVVLIDAVQCSSIAWCDRDNPVPIAGRCCPLQTMEVYTMQNLFLNIYASAIRWNDSMRVGWFTKSTKNREQKAFHDLIAEEIMDGALVPATTPEQRADTEARVYVTMEQLESLDIPKVKKGQYHVLLLECPLYVSDGTRVREDETALERKRRERRAKKAEEQEAGSLFSL